MSIRTSLTLAALVAIPVLSVACVKKESVDSRDVTTHGMSLEFLVKNDGSATKVEAMLHVGSHETYVYARLSDGEQLILTDPSGDKRALAFTGTQNAAKYGSQVTTGAGDYTLDFLRVKGAASALGNKVTLPAGFTLTAPTSVPRNQPLTFTWDATPGTTAGMSYTLSGECIQAHVAKDIAGDPGTFTINAGELQPIAGKENASCRVTLTVIRASTSAMVVSNEFGHKSLGRATQERVAQFDSVPAP